ncbi:MAG: TonB-dependent receptor [Burkholderiales bacterium]|nr:MAG: TonB-dependent receptor [Burkholderiales bacterium]
MRRCVPVNRDVARKVVSQAVAVLLLSLMQPIVAHAQATSDEEDLALSFGDKSTVSIATGSQQPLRRAPAVATVITAEDIAAMGATDLDQVLETVPGIHVNRSVQGYSPLYVVRGIYSDYNPQTLMLQNGVPMTTLFIGNRGNAWFGLPVENIARIEIIRGPGSALYGADAYSGVINIITKTAADTPGTEVGVRGGSFDTWNTWVQHGGKLGPLDVAGYLSVGHTDGFKRAIEADTQTYFDGLFSSHASLAPGTVNTGYDSVDGSLDLAYKQWRFRAGYKLRDNGQTGPGISGALDPVGRAKSERTSADLSWNGTDVLKDLDVGVVASYLSYTQQFPTLLQLFPPGAFGGAFPDGMLGAPNTWEQQLRFSVVSTYRGFVDHNVRFGVGHDDLDLYRTQEIKNFTLNGVGLPLPLATPDPVEVPVDQSFMTPHKRMVDYLYAQDEWRFARDWALTGGVRHDHYSDFGGTTNPRAALVWDASIDLTAKLLYGHAFRAPAFTELYSINNPVVRGNPDLKPETINTWEAAFAWQARPDMDVNLSLFRYRMKDIIRVSNSVWNNTGAQHGHGFELETIWKVSRTLRVQGNYAWQRSTDEATDQDAGYAPHHHLSTRADWSVAGNWLLGGQLNYVADRKRAAGDTRPDIPDYTTVDLSLRTNSGGKGWEFSGAIKNLFSADAREPVPQTPSLSIPNDLPLPRRSFYLQAIYRM